MSNSLPADIANSLETIPIDFLCDYCTKKEISPPVYMVGAKFDGLHYCMLKVGVQHGEGYGVTPADAKVAASVELFKKNSPAMMMSYLSFRAYRLIDLNLDPVKYPSNELTRQPLTPGNHKFSEQSVDPDDEQGTEPHEGVVVTRRRIRGSSVSNWESDDDNVSTGTAATAVVSASVATQTEEPEQLVLMPAQPIPRTPPPSPLAGVDHGELGIAELVDRIDSSNSFVKFWKAMNCFARNTSGD